MSLPNSPVAVSDAKDVRVVEFTHNKILDEANIKEIGDAILPKILIDFATVDHLSSAALGMLININSKVKARNGNLRLANIKSSIREVFVITKLDKLFKILGSRDEALASFQQPS
jgi:anti-sigma B factor antagonist